MERDQTPKILCLSAGLFVRLLLPAVSINTLFLLSLSFHFFLFSLTAFVRLDRTRLTHTILNIYVNYTWGLLVQKLIIIISRALSSSHMCLFLVCAFSSPLYASI